MSEIILLLQLVSSLLISIQTDTSLSLSSKEAILKSASQAVQISSQALAERGLNVATSSNIWPNYERLQNSYYLTPEGSRVLPGGSILPFYDYLSFGDLNEDGLDDAVVVVKRFSSSGESSLGLAVMLNQGGVLFNITTTPLKGVTAIRKYRILNSGYELEVGLEGGATQKLFYRLLGQKFSSI